MEMTQAASSSSAPPGGNWLETAPTESTSHDCAVCGEPMKARNAEERHLMQRTNEIMIGILRYYSHMYFGVGDVTNLKAEMEGVEIEMDTGVDDYMDEQREQFLEYVDSDDGQEGWKPPLQRSLWSYHTVAGVMVTVILVIGITWILLDVLSLYCNFGFSIFSSTDQRNKWHNSYLNLLFSDGGSLCVLCQKQLFEFAPKYGRHFAKHQHAQHSRYLNNIMRLENKKQAFGVAARGKTANINKLSVNGAPDMKAGFHQSKATAFIMVRELPTDEPLPVFVQPEI
ncbi:unnamed protein product [Amoebophrya sp. A120]|nr:unnamed protein product [Amoebophrya sp. A120]|eukprot:GSA120T00012710001.1